MEITITPKVEKEQQETPAKVEREDVIAKTTTLTNSSPATPTTETTIASSSLVANNDADEDNIEIDVPSIEDLFEGQLITLSIQFFPATKTTTPSPSDESVRQVLLGVTNWEGSKLFLNCQESDLVGITQIPLISSLLDTLKADLPRSYVEEQRRKKAKAAEEEAAKAKAAATSNSRTNKTTAGNNKKATNATTPTTNINAATTTPTTPTAKSASQTTPANSVPTTTTSSTTSSSATQETLEKAREQVNKLAKEPVKQVTQLSLF